MGGGGMKVLEGKKKSQRRGKEKLEDSKPKGEKGRIGAKKKWKDKVKES